jgi:small GTP-binding protein
MNLTDAPIVNQLHIGIFGKGKSGKSTLVNALTGNHAPLGSSVADAVNNSVYKIIEIDGIGSCVLIDTVGFDEEGNTRLALEKADTAIIVCAEEDIEQELKWAKAFKARKAPVIMVINKIDQISNTDKIRNKIYEALKEEPIKISAISRLGIEMIKEEILRNVPEDFEVKKITEDLVQSGDRVLLVLAQDDQGSKGQMKQLQLQTLSQLLEKECIVTGCVLDKFEEALASFAKPPKLIITDSQILQQVYLRKSAESLLIAFPS